MIRLSFNCLGKQTTSSKIVDPPVVNWMLQHNFCVQKDVQLLKFIMSCVWLWPYCTEMSEEKERQWCRNLKSGRTNVNNEERSVDIDELAQVDQNCDLLTRWITIWRRRGRSSRLLVSTGSILRRTSMQWSWIGLCNVTKNAYNWTVIVWWKWSRFVGN